MIPLSACPSRLTDRSGSGSESSYWLNVRYTTPRGTILRRIRNRLEALQARNFEVRVECRDFGALWPAFRDLHIRAWPGSPLGRENEGKFFDALVAREGMQGHLDLSVVASGGRIAAGHFGFTDGRKADDYMPARDRAFENNRVGAVLLPALVGHYGRSRMTFGFMRTLGADKTWYTDTIDMNYRIVIHAYASGVGRLFVGVGA